MKKWIVVVMVLGACLLVPVVANASYKSDATGKTNITAYYGFNMDAYNEISGNAATVSGTPLYEEGATETGSVRFLRASTQYAEVNSSDLADTAFGTNDFAISAIVEITTAPATGGNGIIGSIQDDNAGWGVAILGTDYGGDANKLALWDGVAWRMSSGTITVGTGAWYHLVITRVSGTLYHYINGAASGSVAHSTSLSNQQSKVRLGTTYVQNVTNRNNWLINGHIDNVFVMNGTGLSSGEVSTLYSEITTTRDMTYIGDSITNGSYITRAFANSYVGIVHTGEAFDFGPNLGLSGGMVPDLWFGDAKTTIVTASSKSILFLGVNDERIYGVDAEKQSIYKTGLQATMAWLAVPSTNRYVGTDTVNVTYAGGTWNNSGSVGKSTQTQNATATATVTGTAVLLGVIWQDGQLGTYEVYIDSQLQGSYDVGPPDTIATLLGMTATPRLLVYTGLSAGSHEVQLKVTSTGKNVYFDWVAGVGNVGQATANVYVSTIPRMSAAGYASYGGSDANVAAYNADILSNATQLASFGLSVCVANNHAVIDPATHLEADGLHPNAAGHAVMASTFSDAIDGVCYTGASNCTLIWPIRFNCGNQIFNVYQGGGIVQ